MRLDAVLGSQYFYGYVGLANKRRISNSPMKTTRALVALGNECGYLFLSVVLLVDSRQITGPTKFSVEDLQKRIEDSLRSTGLTGFEMGDFLFVPGRAIRGTGLLPSLKERPLSTSRLGIREIFQRVVGTNGYGFTLGKASS